MGVMEQISDNRHPSNLASDYASIEKTRVVVNGRN